MKNKYIYVIITIALIILGVGAFFLLNKNEDKQNKNKEVDPSSTYVETNFKNEHSQMYEQHCSEKICFTINNMGYNSGMGAMQISVTKNDPEVQTGKVQIILKANGEKQKIEYEYDFKEEDFIYTEIYLDSKEFSNADSYELIDL